MPKSSKVREEMATVRIPKDLLRRLKLQAVQREVPLQHHITEILTGMERRVLPPEAK